MSVTFWFEGDDVERVEHECYCLGIDGQPTPDCIDCGGTGRISYTEDRHAVNVSNASARSVLDALGLRAEDLYGIIRPTEMPRLRQRIVAVVNKTNGLIPWTRPEESWGNVHDFGLEAGRLASHLLRLGDLMVAAQRKGQEVRYG